MRAVSHMLSCVPSGGGRARCRGDPCCHAATLSRGLLTMPWAAGQAERCRTARRCMHRLPHAHSQLARRHACSAPLLQEPEAAEAGLQLGPQGRALQDACAAGARSALEGGCQGAGEGGEAYSWQSGGTAPPAAHCVRRSGLPPPRGRRRCRRRPSGGGREAPHSAPAPGLCAVGGLGTSPTCGRGIHAAEGASVAAACGERCA